MPHSLVALERLIFGNPLADWLIAGAVAVAIGLLLYAIRHVIGRRLATLAARTTTQLDDVASDLLRRTRYYFILALALRAGSHAVVLTPFARNVLDDLTNIAVLLQFGVWGSAIIDFWIATWSRSRSGAVSSSSTTINAIGALAKGTLWALISLIALKNVWDFDIAALVTGLGIGGIAIALAVQNILGDVFAALSIVLDKPFEVGDTIAVDAASGTVEHIGLKTTRIRALGGEQVIFSNADLLKSRVRNLRRMEERRVVFTIGVTYDTPPEKVEQLPSIIRSIIEANDHTRFDRAHFARFMDSSLEFEVVYFMTTSDYLAFMNTQHSVNIALLRRFNAERIDFAFPTRTIIHTSAEGTGTATQGRDAGGAAAG